MGRLLLVSMFQNAEKILKMAEPHLENRTVTYIPTASVVEDGGLFTEIEKRRLEEMGFAVDELDISTSSYETIKRKLENNDFIYIAGGNTFFLLQELRRTGTDQVLIQEVCRGKLYIGESAGAIVVAPDIGYCAAMDQPDKAPDLKDFTGLHLVDFYVVPHYKNPEMGKAAEDIIASYSESLDLKVIDDNQAILVDGGEIQLLDGKSVGNN